MTYMTIKVDGNIAEHAGLPTYKEMNSIVGGWLEAIHVEFHGSPATMYLNERGKLNGLPVNGRATVLARHFIMPTDFIVGDVLLVGTPDRHGNDTDLPSTWAQLLDED